MKPKELAEIRRRWGFTQEQMAILMEVSGKVMVSHWENGFRSPSAIIQKLYRMLDELPEPDARRLLGQLERFSLKDGKK